MLYVFKIKLCITKEWLRAHQPRWWCRCPTKWVQARSCRALCHHSHSHLRARPSNFSWSPRSVGSIRTCLILPTSPGAAIFREWMQSHFWRLRGFRRRSCLRFGVFRQGLPRSFSLARSFTALFAWLLTFRTGMRSARRHWVLIWMCRFQSLKICLRWLARRILTTRIWEAWGRGILLLRRRLLIVCQTSVNWTFPKDLLQSSPSNPHWWCLTNKTILPRENKVWQKLISSLFGIWRTKTKQCTCKFSTDSINRREATWLPQRCSSCLKRPCCQKPTAEQSGTCQTTRDRPNLQNPCFSSPCIWCTNAKRILKPQFHKSSLSNWNYLHTKIRLQAAKWDNSNNNFRQMPPCQTLQWWVPQWPGLPY